jgi:hypothetical protein
MPIISGKAGTVKIGETAVADVAEWTIEASVVENSHATNSTAGWKTRSAGVKDASGSIKIFLSDGTPTQLIIGEKYTIEFHVDGTGSNKYTGSVMITSLGGVTVDMDEGTEIAAEYSWGANGALVGAGTVPLLTVPT